MKKEMKAWRLFGKALVCFLIVVFSSSCFAEDDAENDDFCPVPEITVDIDNQFVPDKSQQLRWKYIVEFDSRFPVRKCPREIVYIAILYWHGDEFFHAAAIDIEPVKNEVRDFIASKKLRIPANEREFYDGMDVIRKQIYDFADKEIKKLGNQVDELRLSLMKKKEEEKQANSFLKNKENAAESRSSGDDLCEPPRIAFDIDNKVLPEHAVYEYGHDMSQLLGRLLTVNGYGVDMDDLKVVFDAVDRCPEKVTVDATFSFNPVVSVAGEYAENQDIRNYSQWYGNEYVNIAVENTKRYIPVIKQSLNDTVTAMPAFSFKDKEEAERVLADRKRDIENLVRRQGKKLDNVVRNMQTDFVGKEEKTLISMMARLIVDKTKILKKEKEDTQNDLKKNANNIVNNGTETDNRGTVFKCHGKRDNDVIEFGLCRLTDRYIATFIHDRVKMLMTGIGNIIADIDKMIPDGHSKENKGGT